MRDKIVVQPKTYTFQGLAALVGVDTQEYTDNFDFSDSFAWAHAEAIKAGRSEEDAEEAGMKAEAEDYERAFRALRQGVFKACAELLGAHDLEVHEVDVEGSEGWKLQPVKGKTWKDVARALVETINGYGLFGFRDHNDLRRSGEYNNLRSAALDHLGWISSYPEVFGAENGESHVQRAMRFAFY